MAAIISFFLKQYLMTPRSAAAGRGTADPAVPAALEAFCLRYSLSIREREILALVVEGCSNGEMAKRLFISTGTVKTHMHNVFKKTGTGSRTRLLRLFLG
jgi:DNA-binding CsgD family transcriptional regulator